MVSNNILIKNPDFRNLTIADMFSKFADSMDNVIITLLVIKMTGSSMSTGVLLAITTLPGILFSLIGGTLSDIMNQKKIISLMSLLQSILLIILSLLLEVNKVNFFILCFVLFVLESLSRFYGPAMTAATVNIVSKEDYKEAMSSITTAGSIVQMIGSAICATLVTFTGYVATLFINSMSYLSSCFLARKLTIQSKKGTKSTKVEDVAANMKLGLNYVVNNSIVLNLILIISLINFILSWFDVALPFFLTNFINMPIESLGYIKAVSIFMFVIAGIIMSVKKTNKIKTTIFISIVLLGSGVFGLSYVRDVYLLTVLWGGAAFFRTIVSLLLMAELAYFSDKNMMGRVIGFFTLITYTSMLISRLLSGVLVSHFGAATTFQMAGIILIGISLLYFYIIPKRESIETS